MADRPLAKSRALVTGASSGIGESFARRLAARGADLIVTARREDRLRALATALAGEHGVTVDVVVGDLGQPGAAVALWNDATVATRRPDILINNAGFGYHRPFAAADRDRDVELIQLNITSLVELSRLFVDHHVAATGDAPARLLNIASTASFQPVPNMAVYAASKAFVRSFTEALYHELRKSKARVTATCLCPGGTYSEFHAVAGTSAGDYGALANASMLTAERVAEIGIRAMLRGTRVRTTGAMNRIAAVLTKLAPSGVAARMASWVMGAPKTYALPARTGEEPKP
jgi:short-subunit dehydrogenase